MMYTPLLTDLYKGLLWQSSLIEDWSQLDGLKPEAVFSLTSETQTPCPWGLFVRWPIEDGPLPHDLPTLKNLAILGANLIVQNKRIVVFCSAGVNRSSLLSGCILFELGVLSRPVPEYIQDMRPGTLTNTSFYNYLASLPGSYYLTMDLRRREAESSAC